MRGPLWLFFFVVLLAVPTYASTTGRTRNYHHRRELPEKVIVGYASSCDREKVTTAVQQGVNVVIWAFFNLKHPQQYEYNSIHQYHEDHSKEDEEDSLFLNVSLDLKCIRELMASLDEQGYNDTVHLVSMGGWSGPHLDPYYYDRPKAWFDAWQALVGDIFHGFDIDFEGTDELTSPLNYMSTQELDTMGEIFQLAQEEGYLVSIVPAQSYLDIATSKFSHYLNTTDPTRQWHGHFSYFGQNLYAYWLAHYGDYIDLIMIQFYESYSRASMSIHHDKVTPENYLQQYVWSLNANNQSFLVDFHLQQQQLQEPPTVVSLPISKLVWGFGNGWTLKNTERSVFFPSECIQAAYQALWDEMLDPRGFMFWNIGNEGTNGVVYAKELNDILHIRKEDKQQHQQQGTSKQKK